MLHWDTLSFWVESSITTKKHSPGLKNDCGVHISRELSNLAGLRLPGLGDFLLRPRLPVLIPVMCHAQTLKTVNVVLAGLEAWQKACEGLLQNQTPNLKYLNIFAQNHFVSLEPTSLTTLPPCVDSLTQCLVNDLPSYFSRVQRVVLRQFPGLILRIF